MVSKPCWLLLPDGREIAIGAVDTDYNGTLLADAFDGYAIGCAILTRYHLGVVPFDDWRVRIAAPGLRTYLREEHGIVVSCQDLHAYFDSYFSEHGPPRMAYGARRALRTFLAQGIPLALVTRLLCRVALRELKQRRIASFFGDRVFCELNEKETVLREHAARCAPSALLFVTDTANDVSEAKRVPGVIVAGHTRGWGAPESLTAAGADLLVSSWTQLMHRIRFEA